MTYVVDVTTRRQEQTCTDGTTHGNHLNVAGLKATLHTLLKWVCILKSLPDILLVNTLNVFFVVFGHACYVPEYLLAEGKESKVGGGGRS